MNQGRRRWGQQLWQLRGDPQKGHYSLAPALLACYSCLSKYMFSSIILFFERKCTNYDSSQKDNKAQSAGFLMAIPGRHFDEASTLNALK